MSFYFNHNIDRLEMIWYDNLDKDEDEAFNLDDRNHLHIKKYWINYVPGNKADYVFGP